MVIKFDFQTLKVSFPRRIHVTHKTSSVLPKWINFLYAGIFLLSIGAWLFYHHNSLILSYNDARSHLNVARRVVSSLQPGLAQLGSVWLPLFHVLEVPTINFDFMYKTGLSGSVISMLAFVGSAIFMVKMLNLLDFDVLAIIVGLMFFVLNPNMLFMQSIPMTESLLIFTSFAATYYFAKWVKHNHVTALILSGTYSFLSILTRYDGWFLFLYISACIVIISLFRTGKKKAESNFILYASIGMLSILLWLLWNLVIFGDPLFFMDSQYSAKAQQDILLSQGRLYTKGNLMLSIYTYFLAIKENLGLILFSLGAVGLVKVFLSKMSIYSKFIMSVLLTPIAFNILSLYLGQSVLHLPQLPPYTWFNDRYGLLALPVFAIGLAHLVKSKKIACIVAALVIVLQSVTMHVSGDIITVQDGLHGSSGNFLDDIGLWLNKNAQDGFVLVAASSHDALIYMSGLQTDHFITEGMEKYWNASLEDPTKFATYVIMHEGDLVYDRLHKNPLFTNNYSLIFSGQLSNVYKLNDGVQLSALHTLDHK